MRIKLVGIVMELLLFANRTVKATLFSIQTLVVCAGVEMGKQVAATGAGGGCEFRGYRRRLAAQRWRANFRACGAVLADEMIPSAKPA
jgi:hypothetical protein